MTNQQTKRQVAIIGGKRTPFVKAGTVFHERTALDMAIHSVNGTIRSTAVDPGEVNEIVMGTAYQGSGIAHIARQISLKSNLSPSTRSLSISDHCISGVTAVRTVHDSIMLGRSDIGIAGGAESMSNMPLVIPDAIIRNVRGIARQKVAPDRDMFDNIFKVDDILSWLGGLVEPSTGLSMGEHTELTVKEWKISRQAQDEYAFGSHQKAVRAAIDGRFVIEIEPLDDVSSDGQIRSDTSMEKLAVLKPVFDRTETGTITAGNASPFTDGAASMLLMEASLAENRGLEPLAMIRDFEYAGIDPSEGLLMAPAMTVPRLLQRHNLSLDDIDIFEVHEAFAGQVLANIQAWESGWKEAAIGPVDFKRLNPNGSSLALGHPLGATGARIILSLANEMKLTNARYGLASVCASGGLAAAVLLERP